jgi:AraC family transcriptional regulator
LTPRVSHIASYLKIVMLPARMSQMRYDDGNEAGLSDRSAPAHLVIPARCPIEVDRCNRDERLDRAAGLLHGEESHEYPTHTLIGGRGGLSPWQARKVSGYVESNIAAKILISDLAGLAHFSAGHFFRTFKASFGMSPQAYIMRQRIRRAATLMKHSNESIAKIAVDCGLCDQAHLTRAFRRMVGVTPNAWRRHVVPRQTASRRPSSRPQSGVTR